MNLDTHTADIQRQIDALAGPLDLYESRSAKLAETEAAAKLAETEHEAAMKIQGAAETRRALAEDKASAKAADAAIAAATTVAGEVQMTRNRHKRVSENLTEQLEPLAGEIETARDVRVPQLVARLGATLAAELDAELRAAIATHVAPILRKACAVQSATAIAATSLSYALNEMRVPSLVSPGELILDGVRFNGTSLAAFQDSAELTALRDRLSVGKNLLARLREWKPYAQRVADAAKAAAPRILRGYSHGGQRGDAAWRGRNEAKAEPAAAAPTANAQPTALHVDGDRLVNGPGRLTNSDAL